MKALVYAYTIIVIGYILHGIATTKIVRLTRRLGYRYEKIFKSIQNNTVDRHSSCTHFYCRTIHIYKRFI